MSIATLRKARRIVEDGGIDRTGPTTYEVTSTSGETYVVELTLARCNCPARGGCAHKAAVEIARSIRRRTKKEAA